MLQSRTTVAGETVGYNILSEETLLPRGGSQTIDLLALIILIGAFTIKTTMKVKAPPAGAAATVESKTHALARTTSLIALVVQQVALVLLIRYSRTREQPGTNDSSSAASYLISTAVVSAEVGKLLLNLLLEIVSTTYFNDNSSKEPVSPGSLWNELFSRDSWRLLVPAFLYVVQNNLLFVALENLSVPLYQVTNQGKLLTTAFCSRWLLKKNISGMQYVSLLLLAAVVGRRCRRRPIVLPVVENGGR
jgi:hypothetical protein